MEHQSEIAVRVSLVSIAANVILSLMKLAAGIIARSGAMVSDAVHSASDVLSTVVVIIGIKASAKAPDREHPYGHERMECAAAIGLAVSLLITGLFIGYAGIRKIVDARETVLAVPGMLALGAAIVSIAVKETMFWYTRYYAKLVDSNALMADAWHHRSDALSSIGALIGIAGARMGLPVLDPLASIIICAFIIKAAVDIFRDAMQKLVDHSCDPETEEQMRQKVLSHPEVCAIDLMRTREFGSRIYIELEIAVDGDLPLVQAHNIAEQVHDDIEETFPKVKHIMIHVNPAEARES